MTRDADPGWGLGPFTKHPGNPIMTRQGSGWESHAIYNPTAWSDGERVYLLYRAEGPGDDHARRITSRIGLAVSDDGVSFTRRAEPVITPTEPYELPGGCEDPRIVQIDGIFCLSYTAYDGRVARLAMATSHDLLIWEKTGLAFTDDQWDAYFPRHTFRDTPRGWSKSGALLPTRVHGRYWMYFGDTHIWAAFSHDLRTWTVVPEPVLSPRPGHFDSRLVEPGPAPLILDEGIWLGYNSADDGLRYAFGQALIDPADPTRVIRRSDAPLLEPTIDAEMVGQVPQVVFAEGLVRFRQRWLLYYGMADSRLGVASAPA